MTLVATHLQTTVSPGRRGSPHTDGAYWLDKRPDGCSPLWAVAWYDPVARTVRRKSTRTADLGRAKDFMARFAMTHDGHKGRPAERRQSDFVYFIGGELGAIKIGLAGDVSKRLATIQSNSPISVRVMASIAGGRDLEMAYHKRFAASRLHGEWFERTPELLAEIERLTPPRTLASDEGEG